MAGLVHPAGFTGSAKRSSSFHCKFTGRGAGGHRRAKDRPYKAGEAVRAIRYILREAAREIEEGGIVGNISVDPDIVASLFAAVEELELTAGRDNANVYMSLVVSLPHELTPDERKALLAHICAPLAEHDLPHVGVLHNPDPSGDPRNFHGHVVFSWRPFQSYDDGSYGFSEQTWGELNGVAFITEFRTRAANAMNEAMAAAGHARRFTPLSRAALGEAPKDKTAGKLTAGQKHASRRQEDIALGELEQRLIADRQASLARVEQATRTIMVRAPLDRSARLAKLQQAESTMAVAQREQLARERATTAPGVVTIAAPLVVAARLQVQERAPEVRQISPIHSATSSKMADVVSSANNASPADEPELRKATDRPMKPVATVSHEKQDRAAKVDVDTEQVRSPPVHAAPKAQIAAEAARMSSSTALAKTPPTSGAISGTRQGKLTRETAAELMPAILPAATRTADQTRSDRPESKQPEVGGPPTTAVKPILAKKLSNLESARAAARERPLARGAGVISNERTAGITPTPEQSAPGSVPSASSIRSDVDHAVRERTSSSGASSSPTSAGEPSAAAGKQGTTPMPANPAMTTPDERQTRNNRRKDRLKPEQHLAPEEDEAVTGRTDPTSLPIPTVSAENVTADDAAPLEEDINLGWEAWNLNKPGRGK